jgi:phenylpropionate dioxygenase-like ring-hydroxylating dioxygenase large terminal subunit
MYPEGAIYLARSGPYTGTLEQENPVGPETDGFLMNCWYVAAWDHELIDGKLLARTLLERPVLLYRGDSGRVVALDNRCCHRGAKLSNGRREGDDIRCMYHGLKFEPGGK